MRILAAAFSSTGGMPRPGRWVRLSVGSRHLLDSSRQSPAGPRGETRSWHGTRAGLPERRYSKRIVDGAVILRSSGSVSAITPKAATRPMPMIV